jgi:hypothetical protein
VIASSVVANEQTIRRKDFRGDQETREAEDSITPRSCWRWEGLKISGFARLVMRRVFVGVAGWVSGGIVERSRVRPREEARDLLGVDRGVGLGESFGDSIVDILCDTCSGERERWCCR